MSRHRPRLCTAYPWRMLPAMAGTRSGFTLVEILISIMIFVVVSGAMIGILLIGTDLFRRGEFSRAANDETVTVVGTIEDDIKHMVPAADGGWIFAGVLSGETDPHWANGDCILAFLITNPDPSLIQHDGTLSRLKVAYGCYQGQLRRATEPLTTTIQDPLGKGDISQFVGNILSNIYPGKAGTVPVGSLVLNSPNTNTVVTTGCLHFGVYLLINGDPANYPPPPQAISPAGTPLGIDWEATGGTNGLPPWNGQPYDTNTPAGGLGQAGPPMPSVLRLSLVLTGGSRFAPRGMVINDTGSTLRISGLSALPTTPGSMLRIDAAAGGSTEWIGYSGVTNSLSNGMVINCLSPRSMRRTASTTHQRGDLVQVGQTYSIVRTLPQ